MYNCSDLTWKDIFTSDTFSPEDVTIRDLTNAGKLGYFITPHVWENGTSSNRWEMIGDVDAVANSFTQYALMSCEGLLEAVMYAERLTWRDLQKVLEKVKDLAIDILQTKYVKDHEDLAELIEIELARYPRSLDELM